MFNQKPIFERYLITEKRMINFETFIFSQDFDIGQIKIVLRRAALKQPTGRLYGRTRKLRPRIS